MDMRARLNAPMSLLPIYLSIVVLGSIVAHLASEFFAMGSDADAVAISPKHFYLGVAALAALFIATQQLLTLWRNSRGGRDLKRALHVGLESLPCRGRGAFFALTAGLQLGVGLATQIGEGCPFCGHDIAAGVIGALLTVVVMAFASRAISRRLPSIAAAIGALFVDPAGSDVLHFAARAGAAPSFPLFVWFEQLYNRPPPSLSIA